MVVNVASKCGFTPQYAKLEELYEKYGKDDFVVIGFPANNFLHQEPGTNEEIKEFCTLNYGVTFPMMAKISVKGKDIAPLYQWLTHKSENGVSDAKIGWNFHKFLIDENGRWVASIGSTTSPLSQESPNCGMWRWLPANPYHYVPPSNGLHRRIFLQRGILRYSCS